MLSRLRSGADQRSAIAAVPPSAPATAPAVAPQESVSQPPITVRQIVRSKSPRPAASA